VQSFHELVSFLFWQLVKSWYSSCIFYTSLHFTHMSWLLPTYRSDSHSLWTISVCISLVVISAAILAQAFNICNRVTRTGPTLDGALLG
jgi:hypothetical protein